MKVQTLLKIRWHAKMLYLVFCFGNYKILFFCIITNNITICKQNFISSLKILNFKIKNFDTEFFFLLLRSMKIDLYKIIFVCIGFLFCNNSIASTNPPQPTLPLPPPQLPIGTGMMMLVIAALILAFYKYKKSFKIS